MGPATAKQTPVVTGCIAGQANKLDDINSKAHRHHVHQSSGPPQSCQQKGEVGAARTLMPKTSLVWTATLLVALVPQGSRCTDEKGLSCPK
jgi:hypothetical protein